MSISNALIGQRVGVYQVDSLLGVGGMGEVYRARDTKLGRDVAIKILPHDVADDPDRLARFEREARVLASLNHPHIGAIYGFEDASTADGRRVRGLVLELVGGTTLAEQLAGGAIAVPEALAIARQIAEALDAAHQQGIIHRDLKPANVKINAAGVVKVLDFGLAKATSAAQGQDATNLTIQFAATREGSVVGTAPYMSPEQARGHSLDKRTDIWAFGCVLYEMLTGRRAFPGGTMSDTVAAILQGEPDWDALPRDTPAGVLLLTRRCLEKNPQRRLRDLGDADLALDVPATIATVEKYPRWVVWAAAATAAIAVALAGVLGLARFRDTSPPATMPLQFQITPPVMLTESGTLSVSPDGRHLVFGGADAKGIFRLWIRSLDTLETTALPGFEGEEINFMPPVFWSPDSRFIAFYSEGKIKRMERSGSLPRVVCEVPGVAVGGTWNRSDVIVVGNSGGGLVRCPAGGGVATPMTALDAALNDTAHMVPVFLPDDHRLVYLRANRTDPSQSGLYLGDLDAPPDRQSTERLVATPFGGGYVPAPRGDGYLVFQRDASLMAVRYRAGSKVAGEPTTLANGVRSFRDGGLFSIAGDTLAYRGGAREYQLTWLDRRGGVQGVLGEPGELGGAALSPDETRVAMWRTNRLGRSSRELWLVDVLRNAVTPFATAPEAEAPAWSANGKDLFFALGTRAGSINRKAVDGNSAAETLLRKGGGDGVAYMGGSEIDATADGRFVVITVEDRTTSMDLWLLPLAAGAKPIPLVQQNSDQINGRISPDGRWLAYLSNETGTNEVFVRPLTTDSVKGIPVAGSSIIVSSGGGISPRWRKDGRELFYQTRAGAMMAVAVNATVGTPTELFRAPGIEQDWSVTADGQRFLVAAPSRQSVPAFTVVVNWQSTLKR
jgi:tRNA A-37 threonylcarbamoyl transferase component Bud32